MSTNYHLNLDLENSDMQIASYIPLKISLVDLMKQ